MPRSRSPIERVVGAIVPTVIDAVDADGVVQKIDVDQLVDRIDIDALVGRVDIDGIIQRVDIDGIIQRVDIDGIIRRVDIDGIIQRVDIDALMQRVDIDALMARVDVGALITRVDLNEVMAKVDVNALLSDLDVNALARSAGIDQIVAEATSGIASRTLNSVRRQIVRLDRVLLRICDRIFHRGRPPRTPIGPGPVRAGPLGRTLAFLVDWLVVSVTFGLGVALGATMLELFTGHDFDTARDGSPLWLIAYFGWWGAYLWLSIALSGRTVGKGLLGLRVAELDGAQPHARRALIRTLVFPFSFILGLGFVPAVVGRQRRALHDYAAGTMELVDWETPAEVVVSVEPGEEEPRVRAGVDVHVDGLRDPLQELAGPT